MISVIIPTLNDEARLVGALEPLIPASMEGLVRELVVVDLGSTDATLEIADDAGARIVNAADRASGLTQAVKDARGTWLLFLDPGVTLQAGWEIAVREHLNASRAPALFKLQRKDGGFLGGLFAPRAMALLVLKQACEGGLLGRIVRNGHQLGVGQARRIDARGRV